MAVKLVLPYLSNIMKTYRKRKGITIVELAFAMLLIVILVSAGMISAKGTPDYAKRTQTKADIATLSTAISTYRYQVGRYPDSLNSLMNAPFGSLLITSPNNDPWGSQYSYSNDGTKYAVWSKGKNKINNSTGTVPTTFGGDDIGICSQ